MSLLDAEARLAYALEALKVRPWEELPEWVRESWRREVDDPGADDARP